MNTEAMHRYLTGLGSRLRAEANDLKRTTEALARETGTSLDLVQRVFDGKATRAEADQLARTMCECYPISSRDIGLDPDDSDEGVVVWNAIASASTSRVFDRPQADGTPGPYYEYRDTAMKRGAPFRPEWIQPLRIEPSGDANSTAICYNKGHLLHQFTFFIGAVNFYWEVEGTRYCRALNTGDSCYITPFVPHSFASRDSSKLGLIIAVTYGGALRTALPELSGVNTQALAHVAGAVATQAEAFATRVRRYLDEEMMDVERVVEYARDSIVRAGGVASAERLDSLRRSMRGECMLEPRDVATLAQVLNVPASALGAVALPAGGAVEVRTAAEAATRELRVSGAVGCTRVSELVRTSRQPQLKAFDLTIVAGSTSGWSLHGLHEYIYNHGEHSVVLSWEPKDGDRREVVVEPGGSAYVRPLVPRSYSFMGPNGEASLLVVRVPGLISDRALDEYATAGPTRLRALHETGCWF